MFLPGESHGQRSLAGHGPWGHRESDTTEVTEHKGNWIVGFPLEAGDWTQNHVHCEDLLDSHLLNSAVKRCVLLIASIFLMLFSGSHGS